MKTNQRKAGKGEVLRVCCARPPAIATWVLAEAPGTRSRERAL